MQKRYKTALWVVGGILLLSAIYRAGQRDGVWSVQNLLPAAMGGNLDIVGRELTYKVSLPNGGYLDKGTVIALGKKLPLGSKSIGLIQTLEIPEADLTMQPDTSASAGQKGWSQEITLKELGGISKKMPEAKDASGAVVAPAFTFNFSGIYSVGKKVLASGEPGEVPQYGFRAKPNGVKPPQYRTGGSNVYGRPRVSRRP